MYRLGIIVVLTISKEETPRQKLLEVIASKGPVTIKELKEESGLSTASLHHHLSRLSEYVTQDQQKRYLLSNKGHELFAAKNVIQMPKKAWYVSFMLPAMRNSYASILTIIAVLLLYAIIYSNSSQLILLPVKYGSVAESVALGWVVSVLVTEGLSIAAGARPGRGMLALASGMSIATIPVVAFSMIADITYSYIASIPLYALALFIASSAISNAKNLSYASSIPVALSVLMISITIFTANLGPIIALPIAIIASTIVVARLRYFDIVEEAFSRRH
jgi:hypothetical protein